MNNYRKGTNIEEELARDRIPIENLPDDFLWMHVRGGTKVGNVVDFARKNLESGQNKNVVWSGSGGGVGKTISCAEILKRNSKWHQVTRLGFQKVEETWEPLVEGLDEIVVRRQIPAIHIWMSLDEIDPGTPGYQVSTEKTSMSFKPKPAKKEPYNIPQNQRKSKPKAKKGTNCEGTSSKTVVNVTTES